MAGKRAKRLNLYGSPAWIGLRDRARKRAGCTPGTRVGRCELCGLTYELAVHHVKPVAKGGAPIPELDGVQAICHSCHRTAHFEEKTKRTDRRLRKSQRGWNRLMRDSGTLS